MAERSNDAEIKRVKSLFIQTKACDKILERMNSKRYVVIKGNTGDGKTTLAHYAIAEMRRKGKKPLEIYSYKEWDDLVPFRNNLVVFIDNIFGELSTSDVDVTQWSNRFRSMKAMVDESNNWNCLILVLRTDIFKQIRLSRKSEDFLEDVMVDINVGGKYHLTGEEKNQIYIRYLPNQTNHLKKITSPTTVGFPQCCRMAADFIKSDPKSQTIIPSLFSDPKFVRDDIKKCIKKGGMGIAVLAYVLFKGGKVQTNVLKDTNLDKVLKGKAMDIFSVEHDFRKFAHSVSNYEDNFLIHDEEEDTYRFSHSSFTMNVFLAIGETNPLQLLENCSYSCLPMVTTVRCYSNDLQSLPISRNYHNDLAIRIRLEFQNKPFESQKMRTISELSVWRDDEFIDEYLKNEPCGCSLETKDENGWSVLVHFAIAGNLKWVRHLCENHIKEVQCPFEGEIIDSDNANGNGIPTPDPAAEEKPTQLQLALTHACSTINNAIVKYLISKGGIPDITSCFYAVKAGNLEIIKILVENGADLTQKRRTLSKWDTVTTVLDEAGIYQHAHLMIPLWELCPALKDINSSINASPVHFAAASGNIEFLEYLINNYQFTAYDQSDIGSTILHFASQNSRLHTVKHIINRYERLFDDEFYCYDQGTVLHTAAQSGNVELFQYLYEENLKYLNKCGRQHITLDRGCEREKVFRDRQRSPTACRSRT